MAWLSWRRAGGPQESWEALTKSVVAKYLGALGRHPRSNPEPEDEPAFRRSKDFAEVGAREFPSVIERDVPSILGWVYSSSVSARHRFGERAAEFERELAEALGRASPSGIFRETVETEVVVIRKRAATA